MTKTNGLEWDNLIISDLVFYAVRHKHWNVNSNTATVNINSFLFIVLLPLVILNPFIFKSKTLIVKAMLALVELNSMNLT